MSRNQSIILVIAVVIGILVYFGHENEETSSRTVPAAESTNQSDSVNRTFAGYDCTGDCSGHEAGYRWAEEHDITDGDDCDTAGEHSNSPSFAEGCHAYVDGESDQEDSDDQDNEN